MSTARLAEARALLHHHRVLFYNDPLFRGGHAPRVVDGEVVVPRDYGRVAGRSLKPWFPSPQLADQLRKLADRVHETPSGHVRYHFFTE